MTSPTRPAVTLEYTQHPPGAPRFSDRSDGLPGVEVDIPPQNQRWRAKSWPPRTPGAWIVVIAMAAAAVLPAAGAGYIAWRAPDRVATAMFVVGTVVSVFMTLGGIEIAKQLGRRRTTLVAGPDGLTLTTVGGLAWPRPRHWTRDDIADLIIRTWGRNSEATGVVLVLTGARRELSLPIHLLPQKEVQDIVARLRAALGLPTKRFGLFS